MAVKTETIRELQVLSQGRGTADVSATHITEVNGKPELATAGYPLSTYESPPVLALMGVQLSERPGARDTLITIGTVDPSSTYRVTINGNDYDYGSGAGDTVDDVTEGLANAIGTNESSDVTPIDNQDGTLTLRAEVDAAYTIATSIVGGSGTISHSKDASSVSYRVWGYLRDRGWHLVPSSSRAGVTLSEADRFSIAGLDRVYIEITYTDGRVRPLFQPALLED